MLLVLQQQLVLQNDRMFRSVLLQSAADPV